MLLVLRRIIILHFSLIKQTVTQAMFKKKNKNIVWFSIYSIEKVPIVIFIIYFINYFNKKILKYE